MTGNNIHSPEQGAEKLHLKPTEQPLAGTAITNQADNTVQQRLKEREALQAFRLTRDPNNSFAIDMGDGLEVKDKRPVRSEEIAVAGLAGTSAQMGVGEAGKLAPIIQPQETQIAFKVHDPFEHLKHGGTNAVTNASSNSFAIDTGDGLEVKDKRAIDKATQLATGESKSEHIALKPSESLPSSGKAVPGSELIKIAEKLGHDPHRWQQTENSPSPKCNQYVEAVLKAGQIPFPWKAGFADCHAMREALDKECQRPGSKWEKVYVYDYKHGSASDDQFTHYVPKNGDVMIWDGPWGSENVQHSGIAAEPYDILYAGSQSVKAPHGWAHGKITDFTQSTKSYGAPTAVYRYKGP